MNTRRGVNSKSVDGVSLEDALSATAGIMILQGGTVKDVAAYPTHDGKEKIPTIYGGYWSWRNVASTMGGGSSDIPTVGAVKTLLASGRGSTNIVGYASNGPLLITLDNEGSTSLGFSQSNSGSPSYLGAGCSIVLRQGSAGYRVISFSDSYVTSGIFYIGPSNQYVYLRPVSDSYTWYIYKLSI